MDTNSKKIELPLVTILILTYNRANYLKQTIESVLVQSYRNWRLIIIDDGSTDSTESLLSALSDPRIDYIRHKENAGLYTRRVESLTMAQGKYVAVLDSDDYWLDKDKLKKQVEFLEEHPNHVLVGTFVKLVSHDGSSIGEDVFSKDDRSIRNRLLQRNQFTHSAVLIRLSTLEQTEGYMDTLAEDLDLFLQLGQKGELANLPIFATAHRIHSESANDRGIKMATAVHKIVKKYRGAYPNYLFGYSKSLARMTIARFRRTILSSI